MGENPTEHQQGPLRHDPSTSNFTGFDPNRMDLGSAETSNNSTNDDAVVEAANRIVTEVHNRLLPHLPSPLPQAQSENATPWTLPGPSGNLKATLCRPEEVEVRPVQPVSLESGASSSRYPDASPGTFSRRQAFTPGNPTAVRTLYTFSTTCLMPNHLGYPQSSHRRRAIAAGFEGGIR